MEQAIATVAQKLAIVNNMTTVQDLLMGLTLIQFSNDIVPSQDTELGDLVEPDYPGYQQLYGQTGSTAYEGGDTLIHSSFPDQVFVATVGQTQQTTATFAGTVTTSGNMTVIVTSSGMAGSPITKAVPVLIGDGPNQLAAKAAVALRSDTVIGGRFNISVSGANVLLTRKVAAANDATLNVSSADGTSVGVTSNPTSAATRAGSATGSNVSAIVVGWGLLNAAGDTLLFAARLPNTVSLGAPGQGGVLSPDYVYGF